MPCGASGPCLAPYHGHIGRRLGVSVQETVGGGLVKMLLLAVFVIVCSLVSGHMDDLIESLIFDGRVEYQIQVIYRGVVIRVGESVGICKIGARHKSAYSAQQNFENRTGSVRL